MYKDYMQIIVLQNGDLMIWDWEWCKVGDYLHIPKDKETDEELAEVIENRWTVEDYEIPYLIKLIKGVRKENNLNEK